VFGKVREGGKTKELDNERERKRQIIEQGGGGISAEIKER
jgi:hypothetical protein